MIRRFILASVAAVIAFPAAAADRVDYRRQIKPLLMRRCVMCHGPVKQEGGLRLDAVQLIRKGGESGPAITAGKPDSSLILKAVRGLDGFNRMPLDAEPLKDDEIALLTHWIERGAEAADEKIAPDPKSHWAFRKPTRPAVAAFAPPLTKGRPGGVAPEAPGSQPASKSPPLLPSQGGEQSIRNPIDAFLASRHHAAGIEPVGEAPKEVLLRRVCLDLIGLPPTGDELQAFLSDESPDAYESVVDRLLSDPAYGERWGRHWMDVWRYSDWYGYKAELRNSSRHIWRWRDWIVESLNADKPYDRMIVEMLAADEADPTNEDALRATGFLARNYYKFNRDVWLDQTVEHTAKAFLGLTVNCARCHDHMYDPIPQREYYQFRAIFEPYKVRIDRLPGQPNTDADGLTRIYDADLDTPTFLYVRGNDKQPDKDHPLAAAVPAFFGRPLRIESVSLPVTASHPNLRDFVPQEMLAAAQETVRQKRAALEAARTSHGRPAGSAVASALDPANVPTEAALALAAAEKHLAAAEADLTAVAARIAADQAKFASSSAGQSPEPAATAARAERLKAVRAAEAAVAQAELDLFNARQTASGDAKKAKAITDTEQKLAAARQQLEKARQEATKADSDYPPIGEIYPATSSGRRLALARWIASRENPLTARVAVNHVWLRHFGEPLVPTVFEFGNAGQPPTHPELLDWLAIEFMDSGWSMKHLHRLMVTSAAYRRSSSASFPSSAWERTLRSSASREGSRASEGLRSQAELGNENAKVDPDNRLLWRMNVRRMEAEVVRDAALWVADQLDRTMSGSELDAKLGLTTHRRSLYYRHAPEKSMTFLETFDGPDAFECYRRDQTVAPQQALALANSTLTVELSRRLASELGRGGDQERGRGGEGETASDVEFILATYRRILSREPSSEERELCLRFLEAQMQRLSNPAKLTAFTTDLKSTHPAAADPAQRARESLVHVLLNQNDFVTIR